MILFEIFSQFLLQKCAGNKENTQFWGLIFERLHVSEHLGQPPIHFCNTNAMNKSLPVSGLYTLNMK